LIGRCIFYEKGRKYGRLRTLFQRGGCHDRNCRTSRRTKPVETGNALDLPDPNAPVLAALEMEGKGSGSWVKNLFILGLSLIIFFNLGLLNNGLSDMLILVLVLIIMRPDILWNEIVRLPGYQNVLHSLFRGGGVGESVNVSMAKKRLSPCSAGAGIGGGNCVLLPVHADAGRPV